MSQAIYDAADLIAKAINKQTAVLDRQRVLLDCISTQLEQLGVLDGINSSLQDIAAAQDRAHPENDFEEVS